MSHADNMPFIVAQGKTQIATINSVRHKTRACMVPDMSNTPFKDVGERIRWHREGFEDLSQDEYGKRAGLKRSQIANWESGVQHISMNGARKLRSTYGLSLDFIVDGTDDALSMTLRQAWRDRPRTSDSK